MKEDIEIVKAFLEECDRDLVGEICLKCNGLTRNAIEHILSDYKRVLKENEEWKKAYQEEKDKQFELLRENQKLNEYIILAPNLDEMTAMKYRNITEEAYIKGRAEEQQKAEQIIYEHYIPKQKIKDKIEELKNKSGGNVFHIQQTTNAEIRLLQDLLESEEK